MPIKARYLKNKAPKDWVVVTFQVNKLTRDTLVKAGVNLSVVCRDALEAVLSDLKSGGIKR